MSLRIKEELRKFTKDKDGNPAVRVVLKGEEGGNDPEIVAKLQAFDGTDWQNLMVDSPTYKNLKVCLKDGVYQAQFHNGVVSTISGSLYGITVNSRQYGFDGGTYVRIRTHGYSVYTVTSTGATSYFTFSSGLRELTWVVKTGATSSAVTVRLQGSLDGSSYFDLDSYTGTADTMRHVVNKVVRYVRAYVDDMGDSSSIQIQIFAMR